MHNLSPARLSSFASAFVFTLGLLSPPAIGAETGRSAQPPVSVNLPDGATDLLMAAGNAELDRDRLSYLRALAQRKDLPGPFAEDLSRMIEYVGMWAEGYERGKKENYLTYIIYFELAAEYRPRRTVGTLLNPMMSIYDGRLQMLDMIQAPGKYIARGGEVQNRAYNKIASSYKKAALAFPKNKVLAMLCGHPIPWPKASTYPADAKAPEWANLQREGLEKMRDILQWWIDNRQKPEGFFGTGWGDDCEIWRGFVPVTVAFDDPEAAESWRRLSKAIWRQPYMSKGFMSKLTDVEHSAEDSSDTIAPMLLFAPEEGEWADRALGIMNMAKNRWTGRNERGQRQFKSTFFSVDNIDLAPARACDTSYHLRALQPALLVWQRTRSLEIGEFVLEWVNTWLDASMRAERGKPAGVTPSAIHWPDGSVGGTGKDWWEPQIVPTRLYDWPGADGKVRHMPNTFLLCYMMTGDRKYLQPMAAMAELRRAALQGKVPGDPNQPGTLAWVADNVSRVIAGPLTKYRLLTGDRSYDDLLSQDGSGYARMRLNGDRGKLVEELRANADALRTNFEMYTSEARAGDRVLVGPQRHFNENPFLKGDRRVSVPAPATLYAMATGNPDIEMYCPINAVRWLTPAREIAALVTKSGDAEFGAELFHFGSQSREMDVELLRLKPGTYTAELRYESGGKSSVERHSLVVEGTAGRVRLKLPSRELCVLRIASAR